MFVYHVYLPYKLFVLLQQFYHIHFYQFHFLLYIQQSLDRQKNLAYVFYNFHSLLVVEDFGYFVDYYMEVVVEVVFVFDLDYCFVVEDKEVD